MVAHLGPLTHKVTLPCMSGIILVKHWNVKWTYHLFVIWIPCIKKPSLL